MPLDKLLKQNYILYHLIQKQLLFVCWGQPWSPTNRDGILLPGARSGQFVNGEPDGEGAFVWPSGDQYTGQWKAGKKHGKGVFTWKSGDRWEGIFDNDVQTAADTVANKG